jgi:hypothetical protein
MFAARLAKLPEFETTGRLLLVLIREIIPVLAIAALQDNIVSRHNLKSFSVVEKGQKP